MKKTILLITLISGLNIITAQNFIPESGCPPIAWCNNNDIISSADTMMNGFTAPGDVALNFSCNSSNLSCVFAEWFTCGHNKNTSLGALCRKENKPGQEYPDNDEFTTEVLSSLQTGITAERIFKFYNKTKRGAIVHKYSNGHTLRLTSKFRNKKSTGHNFLLAFKIIDSKNKTLANPVVYVKSSKKKKGHLILRSDKSLLDYDWIGN